jgi:hypothetical protein
LREASARGVKVRIWRARQDNDLVALNSGESAAMTQADAENSRLSPKRRLGSFHLLRDLR